MSAAAKAFVPDTPERVASALSYLDAGDRELWVKMAFAAKDALGEDGKDVWEDWSRTAENFHQAAAVATWKSAKAGGKIGAASLFYLARQAGWKDGSKPVAVDPAELARRHAERTARDEQAAAEKAKLQDLAAECAKAIWEAAAPAGEDHPYLIRKGVKAHGCRVGKWEVITEDGEIRLITDRAYLVPISDRTGRLWSLQAIFPRKMMGDRDKDYLSGGAKSGNFHAIGRPLDVDDRKVFIIVEGYATGTSIHETTGHCVIVCFDASNLLTVGASIRERQPEAIILFAADNDQFTKRRDGTPWNPGVHAATEAARVVGGCLAVPQFASLDGQPTDFNDLHQHEGSVPVIEQIFAALKAGPVTAEEESAALEPPAEVGAQGDDAAGADACSSRTETHAEDGGEAPGEVDHVKKIADSIKVRLVKALEIDSVDDQTIRKLGINSEVIGRMISGSFWSGSKSKLFLLNDAQNLNQFQAGDAYKFLARTFGSPVDDQAIADLTEEAISNQGLDKTQEKALRRAVSEAVGTVILDHLKYHNQREGVEWRCDMFASEAKMQLLEDKARVVLAHKPFEVCGGYEQEVVDDYKQHFTRFDEFLEFLVQSRFALDRKKCYLWILADSDWGKGFLLGVLNSMRLSVGTSMKEIEAMFEGRPVGRAPEDFKRAFALVVDEFKTVKSELKQLQSEITLSPKNQLTASVEVFAKLFLSAESVASLVTENGVEDQFANRMSIFEEAGSLVKRPLYVEVGNPRYFASVLAYSAQTLNGMVAKMQAMGREEAQTHAERWINEFIKRNGIDTVYERFSDTLPDVAADAVRWMHKKHSIACNYLLNDDGKYYLASPSKRLDEYLLEHFDASEVYAYRRRKPEILKNMSGDGKGPYPHTVNGHQIKSVMLRMIGSASDHPLYD